MLIEESQRIQSDAKYDIDDGKCCRSEQDKAQSFVERSVLFYATAICQHEHNGDGTAQKISAAGAYLRVKSKEQAKDQRVYDQCDKPCQKIAFREAAEVQA